MLTDDQKKAIATMGARFGRADQGAAQQAAASRIARLTAVRQTPPAAPVSASAPASVFAPEQETPAAPEGPQEDAPLAGPDETPGGPAETAEAASAPQPAPAPSAAKPADPAEDERWAREHLRWRGEQPVLDIANALRVLDGHEDFSGRFRYNDGLNKIMDKGAVMLDWRLAELCAVLQERFLPEIAESDVHKALLIHANRKSQKK